MLDNSTVACSTGTINQVHVASSSPCIEFVNHMNHVFVELLEKRRTKGSYRRAHVWTDPRVHFFVHLPNRRTGR